VTCKVNCFRDLHASIECHSLPIPPPTPLPPSPNPPLSLTIVTIAPVHVQLAPRRREAVTVSGRGGGAGHGGGEVRPGLGDGVEGVQVLEEAWATRQRERRGGRRQGTKGSGDCHGVRQRFSGGSGGSKERRGTSDWQGGLSRATPRVADDSLTHCLSISPAPALGL